MMRRRIVAIAGSGRTGSTLLSLLLSQHKGNFNLGQLRDLPNAWLAGAPCSCGHPLTSCPVYAPAVADAYGDDPARGLEQVRRSMKDFFRDAARMQDWSAPGTTERLARRHSGFIGQLAAALDALQAVTGASVFIDASKSPEMALALSLTEGTELFVLNLVRDPRAIAVSWRKRRGRMLAGWEFSRVWARRQRQLSRWSKGLGARFTQVRYEDFAGDARSTVARIQSWAGLAPTPGMFDGHDRAFISWDAQHLYPPANERVLAERATVLTIAPFDDWRNRRYWFQHALALLATHPDGARYARESGPAPAGGSRS